METNKNLLRWKQSIQLEGLHTFDEAQKACPKGYRLPTKKEQVWLVKNSAYHFDYETKEGVFILPDGFELRLPAAGYRDGNGDSYNQGTYGHYWSSSPSGSNATGVYFDGGTANVSTSSRVNAFSVRCVPIEIDSLKPNNKINMETNTIQTQGIEEMTRDELIELVGSLTKEVAKAKEAAKMYQNWKDEAEAARTLAEKKLSAAKALFEVM